jgi:trimeric autotransporter adhesin
MSQSGKYSSGGGGGGGIITIDLDTGSVTGSTITFSPNSSDTAGTVTSVAGSATLIELDFSDAVDNTILGSFTSSGTLTGGQNTGLGNAVFGSLNTGTDNCSIGYQSQGSLQSGVQNNSIGAQSLLSLVSGNYNQAIGFQAGNAYTGAESSNICIGDGVLGTLGESNTLRIGAGTGTSEGQLNAVYISGVYGVTTGSPAFVTVDSVTGQWGSSAGGGGGIATLDGNTGSATGSTVSVIGTLGVSGASVFFSGSGSTLTLNMADATSSTYIGANAGNTSATAVDGSNVGIGQISLQAITSGGVNVAVGGGSLSALLTGNFCTALGYNAGLAYNSSESSNISIGFNTQGVTGENNTLRIGNATGTGEGELDQAFISGINGFVGSSGTMMVTIDSTDQLGVLALPSAGVTTIDGDTGSVTGSTITFDAVSQAGSTVNFSGSGTTMSLNVTDASKNNTMIGLGSGPTVTGVQNTGFSANALALLTTGARNVSVGYNSLNAIVGGSNCTAIGWAAGQNYSGSESSNICIGCSVGGDVGVSHQLRIGSGTGTGTGNLNQAFICGIKGITVTGAAVLVSSTDQLGVAVSSRRFKDNIADMPSMTESLMALEPVTFTYKVGSDQSMQYGLIAEQVKEVMPQLVILDEGHLPQTVKYHDLPVLLLKEIQELRKEVDALKKEVSTPKRRK